eukprot:6201576-Pleurochrysis_carterae.AAC.2
MHGASHAAPPRARIVDMALSSAERCSLLKQPVVASWLAASTALAACGRTHAHRFHIALSASTASKI